MKTLTLVLAFALLPLAMSFAQGSAVFDAAVNSTLGTTNQNITATNTLLTTLGTTVSNLATQVTNQLSTIATAVNSTSGAINSINTSLGTPSSVTPAGGGFSTVQQQVQAWLTNQNSSTYPFNTSTAPAHDGITVPAGPNAGSQADGTQAYNATAGGLLPAIGGTYTDSKNPKQQDNRNPALYQSYVVALAAVNDYYTVRQNSLQRKAALQNLLSEILNVLQTPKNVQDFATLGTYGLLVETINGQIQSCNEDINNAYNDAAVRGMQIITLNNAAQTAQNEPSTAAAAAQLSAVSSAVTGYKPPAAATLTGSSSTSSVLPWTVYQY